MSTAELLREFAKQYGIGTEETNKFLAKYNAPKTLKELSQLPKDMLNHVSYITYLEDPLKTYIREKMYWERYQTITLESVMDSLEDNKDYAEDENDEDKLEYLRKIEKHILDIKFGSVVYDW